MAYQRRGRRDRPERFERPERGGERRDRFERERFEGRDRIEGRGRFEGGADRGQRGRFGGPPGARSEEAAMSLRLDPRRLQLLKQLAAETGMRPGELVLLWVQERIDAERAGGFAGAAASPASPPGGRVEESLAADLAALAARVDALTRRVEEMSGVGGGAALAAAPSAPDGQPAPDGQRQRETGVTEAEVTGAGAALQAEPELGPPPVEQELTPPTEPAAAEGAEAPIRRRRGRPRKTPAPEDGSAAAPSARRRAPRRTAAAEADGHPRIPLHEEMTAVLSERGPMTAAELASAITERGRYVAQRTTKPLDANQVNSRVSHPHYRALFVRQDGKIALAETAP